ncbi:unnamed protein product [Brachionus calyciflorus]|uniref:Beta-1,4-mannosyltransferase n=1 Tax=Brachionus calyciflorus TaxID=104777 RepID=A0A813M5Z4_9BILA|nr:unnamed protein product [Brachionus calyciflorus]
MIELLITIAFSFLTFIGLIVFSIRNATKNEKSACIIVLGDIGRSPRMNYHCLSLLKLGYSITFIGYKESKLMDEIEQNKHVKILALQSYPKYLQFGPSILQYVLKTIFLTLTLLFKLLEMRPLPKFILVQNPPSIPTLGLVYFYCQLFKSKFVIDWHNYGYTILAIKSGYDNILVKICKKFEVYFGQRSDLNFCVTQAMRDDLNKYKIRAVVMHDKPHERFKELSSEEKNSFLDKLANKYGISVPKNLLEKLDKNLSLLVSSSSWTEDEDFHILIDALKIYQTKMELESDKNLPNLLLLLTGKGPLKEYYQNKFAEQKFKNIQVEFVWLDPNDYPLLLGTCDLGLCFHKSSSNLDLPMKVVDMFGARLPTCALSFDCISELVKENANGLLFKNADELCNNLCFLLSQNGTNSKLHAFRNNLKNYPDWNQEWKEKAENELKKLC